MKETLSFTCAENKGMEAGGGRLQPQALEFLQSVYGVDRRLEELSQKQAAGLTDLLLHTYGLHYVQTTHDTPWDNPAYDTAVQAVFLYVQGRDMASIVADTQSEDAVAVELSLNDVAVRLRDYDQQHQRANATDRPLESVLREYTREPENGQSTRRIVPLGKALFPIIEHALDTPAGELIMLEQDLEAQRTERAYLEHIAQQAERAMEAYAATPEFRRAAARRGHEKSAEVFVIGPGDTDPDSQVLRHMSWLVSTAVFARKDGNTLQDMQEHMNDAYDFHILAVDQSGEHPVPMGALYAKVQSADSLPSIQDIWREWRQPIRVTMRWPGVPEALRGIVPDTLFKNGLPDLRYYPGVLDIMTIAVLPKYEHGGAVIAMYNRACSICTVLGLEYIVNVLDEAAGDMLNKYGRMFLSYAGLPPINYKARRKHANRSVPRWVHVPSWRAWLQTNNKQGYDRFWSDTPRFARTRYHLPAVDRFMHVLRRP